MEYREKSQGWDCINRHWTEKPVWIKPTWSDDEDAWIYNPPLTDDTAGRAMFSECTLEHLDYEGRCEYCESQVVPEYEIIPSIIMTMEELKDLDENAFCTECNKLVKTEPFSTDELWRNCSQCSGEWAISIGTAIRAGHIVITD
jgi:hypothetical protein